MKNPVTSESSLVTPLAANKIVKKNYSVFSVILNVNFFIKKYNCV